jgi:hypothetical protein
MRKRCGFSILSDTGSRPEEILIDSSLRVPSWQFARLCAPRLFRQEQLRPGNRLYSGKVSTR